MSALDFDYVSYAEMHFAGLAGTAADPRFEGWLETAAGLIVDSYRAIVIGGGVAGASIAYHLTDLGWTDVLLVERGALTSGSTFHSAGLVGQLRSSVSLTRMMMYGAELYRRLRDETGTDPGWHEVGSLRLASSKARMEELTRLAGWGQTFGLPLEIISTERARAMFPLFDPAGVEGAAFLPTDGWLDPSGLTEAFAAGARARGAEIRTVTRVVGVDVREGRVRGVTTDEDGQISADVVVNAGGMYANQIGRLAGVEIPVVPFAHQYLLTAPIEGVEPSFPTLRDPDRLVYVRQEAGGSLHVGGYERDPAPWMVEDGPPADFNDRLLQEDWPRFEPLAESAFALIPALHDAEVVKMINGPEAFTPDGEFILGESRHPRLLRRGRLLRSWHRGSGRCRQGDGRVGRARRTGVGPVEDGCPAVRAPVPIAFLCPRSGLRDLRDLLRHPLSRRRATSRTSSQDVAHLPTARRARSRLRREVGVGACELVRLERGRLPRGSATARMGRGALVDGDPCGAHGDP